MAADQFGGKLALVLKSLTISNGRLAADLAVDKSLVGRWISGAVSPSTHNLGRLTSHLARRLPGFSLLDWDRPLAEFRDRLAGKGADEQAAAAPQSTPHARAQSLVEVSREGRAYPGLYAQFRVAYRNTGEVLAELMIIWREGETLRFRSFDPSFSHTGEILIVRHQLFFMGEDDARADGLIFLIMNGVSGQKAFRTDGLVLGVAGDRYRTPGACAIVMQRIADLPRDDAVPPRELLVEICAKMKSAFVEGRIADIAGPRIEAAVRAVVGAPGPMGPTDHYLRAPMDRSLAASEVELSPELNAELERVRAAFLEGADAPPLAVDYGFRSPQLVG